MTEAWTDTSSPSLYEGEALLRSIPAGDGLVVDLIESALGSRLSIRHTERIIDPKAEVMLSPVKAPELIHALTQAAIELCTRDGIRTGAEET